MADNKIKARIWQISGPTNCKTYNDYFVKLFELYEKLKTLCNQDLPELSSLEGTDKPYILCIPADFNPKSIFDEYGVKYSDDDFYSYEMFDLDKFNSNYQLGKSIEDNSYILNKPYLYCRSINCFKVNEDGYPIDKNNNIIEGSMKFPANHIDPKFSTANNHNFKYHTLCSYDE